MNMHIKQYQYYGAEQFEKSVIVDDTKTIEQHSNAPHLHTDDLLQANNKELELNDFYGE